MSYDFDYFNGQDIVAPSKPSAPSIATKPTAADARAYADALDVYEREYADYNEKRQLYQGNKSKRIREFERKLKDDYGLSDLEFNAIWGEAYDRAPYANRLQDVHEEFDRLYHFVKNYISVMV